jgi:hypothetical protein
MVYSREGADMDELVKVYGPQAGILIAVVAYLRLQMEGRLNDCKAEHDDLVRQLDERLTTVERRTDEIDRLIQAELAMHRRKPGAP